jgi:putative tryptophan/tyrosine transport system substrate-binding protein
MRACSAMDRRVFIALMGGSILAAPVAARAQQPGKLYRIGFLASGPTLDPRLQTALEDGLRELGYVRGRQYSIEYRFSSGGDDTLRQLAEELVQLPVDVIIADTNPAVAAARQATGTIPIVMAAPANPVGAGFVQSVARPGGNVTGLTVDPAPQTIIGKQLAVLKECVPKLSRVAALWNPAAPIYREYLDILTTSARQLSIAVQSIEVRSATTFERAFDRARQQRSDGIIVLIDTVTFIHRKELADLAKQYRLPSVAYVREFAEAGGLVAYGADLAVLFRRAAYYVDRIFKGAKPADLPIEQPTKFLLVINQQTAKALGLTIPSSLLVQAQHVIE